MQNKIYSTQAEGIPGKINSETPIDIITRVAEDENCIAGNFVFEGTDGSKQAVGINPSATKEEVLGVVKRAPYLTGEKQSQNYPIDSTVSIVTAGNIEINLKDEDVNLNDKVYIDASTGEVTTKINTDTPAVLNSNDNSLSYNFKQIKVVKKISFNDITYGNGTFVAVSSNGKCVYSTDGYSYTEGIIPTSAYWTSITYGNGTFVAVSSNGKCAYSEDGVAFVEGGMPTSASWTSITYGNGKFVAVGKNVTAYSTDGRVFTVVDSESKFNSVAYGVIEGNTMFVAAGKDGGVGLEFSVDGIRFSNAIINPYYFLQVAYGNGKFVVIDDSGDAYYANDGIDYEQCVVPDGEWTHISYGNGKFVLTSATGDVAYSTDGIFFEETSITNFPDNFNIYNIAYCSDRLFVCGEYLTELEEIKSNVFKIVAKVEGQWLSTTYGNGTFVAVSINGKCAYSEDGVTFTEGVIPSGYWTSITYGNGKFVAVAGEGKCAYSEDGVTFVEGIIPSAYWTSITYGNGYFVAVSSDGKCAYSEDGVTFVEGVIPSEYWISTTYGNGTFVAVSNEGKCVYSEDGVTFVEGVIPSEYWISTTYGNGTFVAVSSDGKCAYSEDGVTFVEGIIPSGFWVCITYGDGYFVAVSSDGKCAYSEDGVTFVEGVIPSTSKWISITYGNGKFVVLDMRGNIAATIEHITFKLNYSNFLIDAIAAGNGTSNLLDNTDRKAIICYANDISESHLAYLNQTIGCFEINNAYREDTWWAACNANGERFAVVSINGSVAFTSDGIDLEEGKMPTENFWCSIAYGEINGIGTFVAVSTTGIVAYCNSGEIFDWGTIPPYQWRFITYGNGKFVAVAGEGKCAYSEDGVTFVEGIIPSAYWTSITYGNGYFVAVSSDGKCAYSEDGVTFVEGVIPDGWWRTITFCLHQTDEGMVPCFIAGGGSETATQVPMVYSYDHGQTFSEYSGDMPNEIWTGLVPYNSDGTEILAIGNSRVYSFTVQGDEPGPGPGPTDLLDTGFRILRRINEDLVTIYK